MIGGLSLLNYSGGRAFAQMIEKVKAASSVHFNTVWQFGKQREIPGVMYLEGNRMRFEQTVDGVVLVDIGDFDRKEALLLNMQGKQAQQIEVDANMARSYNNPIDQLRLAKSDNAEQIGEELLKGRHTRVYRLRKVELLSIKKGFNKGNDETAEMLVWVDVESGLPAKIVIRDTDPKSPMEFRFEEFVWNEPLDASLFSLIIPDGFRVSVVAQIPKKTNTGQSHITGQFELPRQRRPQSRPCSSTNHLESRQHDDHRVDARSRGSPNAGDTARRTSPVGRGDWKTAVVRYSPRSPPFGQNSKWKDSGNRLQL